MIDKHQPLSVALIFTKPGTPLGIVTGTETALEVSGMLVHPKREESEGLVPMATLTSSKPDPSSLHKKKQAIFSIRLTQSNYVRIKIMSLIFCTCVHKGEL